MAEKRNIVIIGGGIIGSTTAYFLSNHPCFNSATHTLTLLEASKIAGGASGKAGGLLALWAYPQCIVPLSFHLHKELAERHDGAERWGYREVECGEVGCIGRPAVEDKIRSHKYGGTGSIRAKERADMGKRSGEDSGELKAAGVPPGLDWLVPSSVRYYEAIAEPGQTAQVHPYQFTTAMAELAGSKKGVSILLGSAKHIHTTSGVLSDIMGEGEGEVVKSVTYVDNVTGEEKTILADAVVLSAGPWTSKIWPRVPLDSLRAHSVTIRPSRPVSAQALFTSITLPLTPLAAGSSREKNQRGGIVTPEIYARPNNEVYACGPGDTTVPLPIGTHAVEVDDSRIEDIVAQVGSISDELRDGEVLTRQACYLPHVSVGEGPIIGETRVSGLVLATGHTCWGIQNAPGTAKVVAEILMEGKAKSADVTSLDPKRFL